MKRETAPSELHPALPFGVAVALHALVLASVAGSAKAPRAGGAPAAVSVQLEIAPVLAAPPHEAEGGGWERVLDSMRRRLRGRRFRVPADSKGLVARVQVARGELARNVEDRYRLEKGAAVGQLPPADP